MLLLALPACAPLSNEALLGPEDAPADLAGAPWPAVAPALPAPFHPTVPRRDDLHVCPDGSADVVTITAALARAEDGATLHLCAATFHEHVVLEGFSVIHLLGDDPAGPAILSGDQVGVPLVIRNGPGSSTDVSGVWFQDGWAAGDGGCVRVEGSPTSISRFVARRCYAHSGGAVAFLNVTGGNLYDGVVLDAIAHEDGGGVYSVGGSIGLWNLDFDRNEAMGRGGHVYVAGSYGIRNVIFTRGTASGDGAAVALSGNGAVRFSTVAWSVDDDLGSLDFAVETDDRWEDNIVADNASAGLSAPADGAAYNLSFGNRQVDYAYDGSPGPGPTDAAGDPLLSDVDHTDVHLPAGSSAIDAADPALLDVDGTRADLGALGGPDADPALAWLPAGVLDR